MIDPALLALATPEERQQYEQALQRESALLSPLDYAESISPETVKRFAHTELLNRYVVALTQHAVYEHGIGPPATWTPNPSDPEDGKWLSPSGDEAVDLLVVSAPPRHGKSFAVTETAPAWYISKYPDRRVILTGYEANFAKGFSRKNREKVREANLSGIVLDDATQAADDWGIKGHPGGVVSAGAGGPITGKGAHLLIIDDPIKNAEEALSETDRRKKWDWWISTAKSRIEAVPGGGGERGVAIVIQTRWHEDDLAGRLVRNERCFFLNIPALAFEGNPDPVDGVARDDDDTRDPLGRKPGEALCPSLHPKSVLEAIRNSADGGNDDDGPGGALWFSCLYQGKPVILGGGILPGPYLRYDAEKADGKTTYTLTTKSGILKRWTADDLVRFITVDLAASVKTRADWTVFSLWGWTPDQELLLLDMDRSRMETPDHEPKARAFWTRCNAEHGPCRFMGIEDKTFGTSLIQTMVRSGGITVRPLKADTDKVVRAIPAGQMMQAGRFYLPRTQDGDDFKKECLAFDTGRHDDMVDTLSYAARVCAAMPRRRKEQGSEQSDVDRHYNNRFGLDGKGRKKRVRHPILGRC